MLNNKRNNKPKEGEEVDIDTKQGESFGKRRERRKEGNLKARFLNSVFNREENLWEKERGSLGKGIFEEIIYIIIK